MITEPSFTIGVEEEYLLVERDTRELVSSLPPPVLAEYRELLGEQVSPEFLQCQIEVGTRVCTTMPELREELVRLRRGVAEVAERNGLAVVAASSHPFARRGFQQLTPRERYRILAEDMQEVARRLVISGMHVHVGIEDPEVRIDLLSQSSYVLPHLLALSTSSPFWEGADTGLKSYRIAVWDEMPRSGLPPGFESWSEYERHIGVLVDAGLIEDASKIWWDLRPSARFPTLEMRICDVCTRLEDALCLAALYRCWLRMMFRLRRGNQRWRTYRAFLLDENRWRAQRYGVDGSLIDFGRGELVAFGDLVEEMLELFAEDAAHFDCRKEVAHARTIVQRGTSAHRQLAVYNDAVTRGAGHEEALRAVVDALAAETLADVPSATAAEAAAPQAQARLRATQISSDGHRRAHSSGAMSVDCPESPASGACSSSRSSTSKPLPRSIRIMSPWARWNSTARSFSGHSKRPIPNWGRCSAPSPARVSRMQRTTSTEFVRKISSPPGRRSRAASGIQRSGSHHSEAPYSETARSKRRVGERDGLGAAVDVAGTRGRARAAGAGRSRAASPSCRSRPAERPGGRATPRVGRAAAQLDRVLAGDVGQDVQLVLRDPPDTPARLVRPRPARRSATYSSAQESHAARLRPACSVSSSDELIAGEPERDLALGGLGRVRAVDEVVGHGQREVAADGSRRRAGRVRRPHRRAHRRDRALALQHERERRRGRDEVDSSPKNGFSACSA